MLDTDGVLVIDASSAVGASLAGDFEALTHYGRLVAPPLMWSEGTSILRELSFRGEISQQDAQAAVRGLENAPIESVTPPGLHPIAFTLATDLGWAKTYDAEYLALAGLLRAPVVTVDERLIRGAARSARFVRPTDLGTGQP